MNLERGYTIKEIAELTGLKYKTLCERINRAGIKPLYTVSEKNGRGTGKGNLYDLIEVLKLFDYRGLDEGKDVRKRGRPRKVDNGDVLRR